MKSEEKQHPNWVRGRANCNLETAFHSLCQIVRRDVDEFNSLSAQERRGKIFRCDETEREEDGSTYPTLSVKEEGKEYDAVRFELTKGSINIPAKFYVRPVWHHQTRSCNFKFKDEDTYLELWQVSQQALSDSFFGETL